MFPTYFKGKYNYYKISLVHGFYPLQISHVYLKLKSPFENFLNLYFIIKAIPFPFYILKIKKEIYEKYVDLPTFKIYLFDVLRFI